MSENLLIIGGTGFIGKNLSLSALKNGYKVVVLSLHIPSSQEKIKNIQYLKADVSKLGELKQQIGDISFDYVVNLSGYINHCNFSEGGGDLINVHFGGVQNILESINLNSLKRFVQLGSSDEYGNCPPPQKENMRELPISPYSVGKVASSNLLEMLNRSEGIPTVVLRLFLVYGPGQDLSRFIPQVIKGCLSSSSFPVSAGDQLRDFCYIDDVINGILLTLKNNKVNGEIINLASGNPIRIREVIELIQNNIGKGNAVFGEIPYRRGENLELYADISKAKSILNWQATTSINEGIKKTINYYQNI